MSIFHRHTHYSYRLKTFVIFSVVDSGWSMKKLSQPVDEWFDQWELFDKYRKLVEEFAQSVHVFLTSGNRVKMGINRLRNLLNRLRILLANLNRARTASTGRPVWHNRLSTRSRHYLPVATGWGFSSTGWVKSSSGSHWSQNSSTGWWPFAQPVEELFNQYLPVEEFSQSVE